MTCLRLGFIGGTGRCGTTVLRQTLAAHPQVAAFPGELRLVTDPGGLLDLAEDISTRWDPYRADAALHRWTDIRTAVGHKGTGRYPRHDLHGWTGGISTIAAGLLEDAIRETSGPGRWTGMEPPERDECHEVPRFRKRDVRALALQYLDTLGRAVNPSALVLVEDTPGNALAWDRLRRLFGRQASFVHVHRHPLDVLASYQSTAWASPDPVVNARRIARILERWTARQTRDLGVLEVAFRDLVQDQERMLERVLAHMQLDVLLPRERTPLDAGRAHIGRWRRDLEPRTVEVVLPVLQPSMERYGYGMDDAGR